MKEYVQLINKSFDWGLCMVIKDKNPIESNIETLKTNLIDSKSNRFIFNVDDWCTVSVF